GAAAGPGAGTGTRPGRALGDEPEADADAPARRGRVERVREEVQEGLARPVGIERKDDRLARLAGLAGLAGLALVLERDARGGGARLEDREEVRDEVAHVRRRSSDALERVGQE